MAKIYISSTYEDLKLYRKAVSDQLTRMQHTVIAMEQYVARDDRPVENSAPGQHPGVQAATILRAMAEGFKALPGGEEGLRFLVGPGWIAANVPGLSTSQVQRSGTFDPLATSQLLNANTPFVPITDGTRVLKVIDRVGVATEIARSVVESQLGRA